jgi:hypothetical protein
MSKWNGLQVVQVNAQHLSSHRARDIYSLYYFFGINKTCRDLGQATVESDNTDSGAIQVMIESDYRDRTQTELEDV